MKSIGIQNTQKIRRFTHMIIISCTMVIMGHETLCREKTARMQNKATQLKQDIMRIHEERLAIIRSIDAELVEQLLLNLNKIAEIKRGVGLLDLCHEQHTILDALQKSAEKGKTDTHMIERFQLLAHKTAGLEKNIHAKIQPLQNKVHTIAHHIQSRLTSGQKKALQSKGTVLVQLRSQLREIQPCSLMYEQENILDLLFM